MKHEHLNIMNKIKTFIRERKIIAVYITIHPIFILKGRHTPITILGSMEAFILSRERAEKCKARG